MNGYRPPKDPWGSDYQYVLIPGQPPGCGVYSPGADRVSLSRGNDRDDLNTWDGNTPWLAYYGSLQQQKSPLPSIAITLAAVLPVAAWLLGRRLRRSSADSTDTATGGPRA